jgi:hypothetical protein
MGSYVDEPSFDRRVALRGLAIVLGVIALAYATAWITVGRSGRFQELKGVFFSLDLPASFERIDQEGSGASLTSLADPPSLERTFASPLRAPDACDAMARAFRRAEAEMFLTPNRPSGAECSFSGTSGRFLVSAEVRSVEKFLRHVRVQGLDVPVIAQDKRAILSVGVRD